MSMIKDIFKQTLVTVMTMILSIIAVIILLAIMFHFAKGWLISKFPFLL